MVDLCDDILILIFLLLPKESLIRLRGVCKLWLHLITENPLVSDHLTCRFLARSVLRSPPYFTKILSLSLLSEEWVNSPEPSLHFMPHHSSIKIAASINGLLFCAREVEASDPKRLHDDCYLCNPCTQEWLIIPKPSRCHFSFNLLKIGLAFNPAENTSSGRATYKIVSAHKIGKINGNVHGFEIYCSEIQEWRVSPEICSEPSGPNELYFKVSQHCAVYHCSVLYWLDYHGYMLAFDPIAEASRWICLPFKMMTSHYRLNSGWLAESCGSLYFVTTASSSLYFDFGNMLTVWKMRDNTQDEWTPPLYSIDLQAQLAAVSRKLVCPVGYPIFRDCDPVGLEQKGNIILLRTRRGKTVCYNHKSKKLQMDLDVQVTDPLGFIDYFPYIPTTKSLTK